MAGLPSTYEDLLPDIVQKKEAAPAPSLRSGGKSPPPVVAPVANPHLPSTYEDLLPDVGKETAPLSTDAGLWDEDSPNWLLNRAAKAGNWINNAGRAIDDFSTMKYGDPVRSYLPSVINYKQTGSAWPEAGPLSYFRPDNASVGANRLNDLRAQTAAAHAALGPVADTTIGAATYAAAPGKALGPLAEKALPYIGRYGTAALEGGTHAGLTSVGGQVGSDAGVDPFKTIADTGVGALWGAGGQAAGDLLSAGGRRAGDLLTGKPGRSGEQWAAPTPNNPNPLGWRERVAKGEDITPDIDRWRKYYQRVDPPGSPRIAALDNLESTLGQSVEPGMGAALTKTGVGTVAGWAGLSHSLDWPESIGLGVAGASVPSHLVDQGARAVNNLDRNINVGQSLDKTYSAMTGRPSTTDTSNWAKIIRQMFIGGR